MGQQLLQYTLKTRETPTISQQDVQLVNV